MFLIFEIYELVFENVEVFIFEVQGCFDELFFVLNKDDINIIVENMFDDEIDLVVVLVFINENMLLNEFIVKYVFVCGEIICIKDYKMCE